jgi:hypothetical protein
MPDDPIRDELARRGARPMTSGASDDVGDPLHAMYDAYRGVGAVDEAAGDPAPPARPRALPGSSTSARPDGALPATSDVFDEELRSLNNTLRTRRFGI